MSGYNFSPSNRYTKWLMLVVPILGLLVLVGWYHEKTVSSLSEYQDSSSLTEAEVIERYYAPLYPMQIGEVVVQASIADTNRARQQGLSGTPYLPESVVKLFIFDTADTWGFWMKDMNYAIDMLWLDEAGQIVHIEAEVHPETYPESFQPPVPALYVVETVAGFVEAHQIGTTTQIDLPVR